MLLSNPRNHDIAWTVFWNAIWWHFCIMMVYRYSLGDKNCPFCVNLMGKPETSKVNFENQIYQFLLLRKPVYWCFLLDFVGLDWTKRYFYIKSPRRRESNALAGYTTGSYSLVLYRFPRLLKTFRFHEIQEKVCRSPNVFVRNGNERERERGGGWGHERQARNLQWKCAHFWSVLYSVKKIVAGPQLSDRMQRQRKRGRQVVGTDKWV